VNLCDQPGGCPLIGQVVSGVKAVRARSAAPTRNVRKRGATPSDVPSGVSGKRECAKAATKASSTVAYRAGGPARNSYEAPARRGGGGAKGPAHRGCQREQPG